MTEPSYPLFNQTVSGRIHLRAYESHLGASRVSDIAAIANDLLDDSYTVVVAANYPADMVRCIDRGWNTPGLTVAKYSTLVELTMALHEAVVSADDPNRIVLLVEDFSSMRTGPGKGHDDEVASRWLRAARDGQADTLESITGLSMTGYLGEELTFPRMGLVIGCSVRNGDKPVVRRIMGGLFLIGHAESVVTVDVAPTAKAYTGNVYGTAYVVKCRDLSVVGAHAVTRPEQTQKQWVAA